MDCRRAAGTEPSSTYAIRDVLCSHDYKQPYQLNPATIYASAIIILCVMTLTSFLFIEMVAHFTKKAVIQVAAFLVNNYESDLEILRDNFQPTLPMLLHQLIDKICPLSTHTPAELPKNCPESSYLLFPPKMTSPCSLCVQGIGMGELCRTLPCGHTFHARCVDRYCLKLSQGTNGRKRCVTCPTCRFVVYPTPDLMNDIVIYIRPEN